VKIKQHAHSNKNKGNVPRGLPSRIECNRKERGHKGSGEEKIGRHQQEERRGRAGLQDERGK
jgi:hypothetical protein